MSCSGGYNNISYTKKIFNLGFKDPFHYIGFYFIILKINDIIKYLIFILEDLRLIGLKIFGT